MSVTAQQDPVSLTIVQFVRRTLPHGRPFHARQVYDALTADKGRVPNFNAVMSSLRAACENLGGGYFQQ